ncbi:MAG TPA: winged helix-turn-helix domain-containing protein [Paraburkholderia sp.]
MIVESDTTNAEILWNEVRLAGHEPLMAFSADRANTLIEREHPQVVLLRWKLPDASGLSLLGDLRTRSGTSRLPVIVFGEAGATEEECLRALEAGADDYIKKPYGIREVLARVQVVLRPVPRKEVRHRLSVETLTMDFDARRAFARTGRDGAEVELELGPTCYRFLRFFVENPYEVLSRKDIIDNVWFGATVKEGIVDVYIRSLRLALKPLQSSLIIETVRGAGFRLSAVERMPSGDNARLLPKVVSESVSSRRPRTNPSADGRLHAANARNEPVLVSDLGAAVEKIRHLQKLLLKKTEENQLLRDAVEAVKPGTSARSEPAVGQKSKR